MKIIDVKTIKNNKGVVANIVAAFGIKGVGMIVNLLSMPLYIDYLTTIWFLAYGLLY